jgi:voltage-gated potassium channel
VVVAPDAKTLDALKIEGLRTHVGDPSVEEDLKLAGIDRARSIVVSQDSDAATLLTVMTARAVQPQLRIVAVATSEQTLPKLRRAGATEAISVVGVAAQLMSSAALDMGDADQPHSHSIPH